MTNSDESQPRAMLRRAGLLLGLALLALVASTSVVFVDESEFVLVETLGRIVAVYDRADAKVGDRGLHFKLPWPVAMVRRFDRRQQLFDPPGREMFTRDKKNITVSSYLCWKIADPADANIPLGDRPVVRFFRGLGNLDTAEARLEARVRSALEIQLGKVELSDLLRVTSAEGGPAGESPLTKIAGQALAELKTHDGAESMRDRLGIELVDLRIKRINLPEGNRTAVYERMRTERERIAERYRSAGLAEKTRIESQARRQSDELLARAEADAERIRGAGEAEAIHILNQAHARDPEFYEFQRTLATYAKILSERTTIVLSSGSRLFRLLTEGVPQSSSKKVDHGNAEDGKSLEHPDAKPAANTKTAAQAAPVDAAPVVPGDRAGGVP
ncbi:MAG TPA: protease modulator HflC [Planctomycetaceae bacterium]